MRRLMMKLYKVVDNKFNRDNYAESIGLFLDDPPAYASVEIVEYPMKFSAKDYNFVAKRFREAFPVNYTEDDKEDAMLIRSTLSVLMLDFAMAYEKDNPRFDP